MAKRKTHDQPEQVRRDGGLCANFVNTLSSKRRSFSSYSELVAWSAGSGAIATSDVERLERTASARPEDAAAVVERAVALRAVLQRMFQARMAKRRLPSSDLEALNAEL
ncbi:MAG: ABATE domain-containing protein, partial [Acidobacteriota bacterium]